MNRIKEMDKLRIESVTAIADCILIIYYSPRRCYQFSIIDEFGCAYDFPEIYYSLDSAEKEGKDAIKLLSI